MTRRDEILKLIVEHFIKTCEPVGSKTLQETYSLGVSSATIRSEMNSLEVDGYLEKPHASGGRIPTAKGYDYYVEHIRDAGVDEKTKNALQGILSEKSKSVEEVLRESCEILSSMTNLASAVLGSQSDEESLLSVQLIPLGGNAASAVFVTNRGYVEHKTFMLEEGIATEKVVSTVAMLNERLKGTPISGLTAKVEAMKPVLNDYLVGQEVLYDAILAAISQMVTDRIRVYGKDELLAQPEYRDPERLRALIEALDDPSRLLARVGEGKNSDVEGVTIALGEDEYDGMALISANVSLPSNPGVSLTLLGPRRMDYARAVSTLRYFAEQLDRYFGGKGDKKECQKQSKKEPAKPSSTKKTSSSGKKNPQAKKN